MSNFWVLLQLALACGTLIRVGSAKKKVSAYHVAYAVDDFGSDHYKELLVQLVQGDWSSMRENLLRFREFFNRVKRPVGEHAKTMKQHPKVPWRRNAVALTTTFYELTNVQTNGRDVENAEVQDKCQVQQQLKLLFNSSTSSQDFRDATFSSMRKTLAKGTMVPCNPTLIMDDQFRKVRQAIREQENRKDASKSKAEKRKKGKSTKTKGGDEMDIQRRSVPDPNLGGIEIMDYDDKFSDEVSVDSAGPYWNNRMSLKRRRESESSISESDSSESPPESLNSSMSESESRRESLNNEDLGEAAAGSESTHDLAQRESSASLTSFTPENRPSESPPQSTASDAADEISGPADKANDEAVKEANGKRSSLNILGTLKRRMSSRKSQEPKQPIEPEGLSEGEIQAVKEAKGKKERTSFFGRFSRASKRKSQGPPIEPADDAANEIKNIAPSEQFSEAPLSSSTTTGQEALSSEVKRAKRQHDEVENPDVGSEPDMMEAESSEPMSEDGGAGFQEQQKMNQENIEADE